MNAPSPLLRPLQVLATVLAVAIAVLFVAWTRKEAEPALAAQGHDVAAAKGPSTPSAAAGAPTAAADTGPTPSGTLEPAPPPTKLDGDGKAVLYGSVRSADGTPPKRGVLWLYRDGKHVGTASGDLGAFVFAGLTPGLHSLRSRIDDELPIDREVGVHSPATRLDIELPGRWLLSINAVTPDGAPWLEAVRKQTPGLFLRGLVALAFEAPLTGDLMPSNLAEVDGGLGRFRGGDPFSRGDKALPKQTIGVLTLPPGHPVHVALILRNTVVAQMPAAAGQTELTFTLPVDALTKRLARVRMRIVDPSGAPVAKAQVALNDAQTGGGGKPTGDDGRVVLEQTIPGRLDVEIRAKDLSAPMVEVVVPPGADLDLGDVMLQPPTNVELRFDEFEGKGSVRANLLDTIRPGWVAKDLYFSTDNGKSMTYPFYPGRYGFLATGPTGVALMVLDLRTPPAGPVRFNLRRGADLRIAYAFGAAKAAYEVASAEGVLVRRRDVSGTAEETVELPPGSYTVRVTDQHGTTTRRDFTLPAAGMTLNLP